MPEPELKAEAKEAIRSYVVKLLVLPATASTILAFFLGYFIKDVATQSAYTDAYKQAAIHMLTISSAAETAKHEALAAKRAAQEGSEDVVKAVRQVRVTSSEAQTIYDGIKTLQAFQKSEETVAEVAKNLLGREDFKKTLIDSAVTDLKNLGSAVTDLKNLVSSSRTGHFIGNYKTHWNDTYVKVIVPVFIGNESYNVDIFNKKIWNENRQIIADIPHADPIIKNGNYFIYLTHFPNSPRPKEVEIEFDWKIIPLSKSRVLPI